jgi:hypothetical protein
MALFIHFFCNTKLKHKLTMAATNPNVANYHTDPATSAVEDFITEYATKIFLTNEWYQIPCTPANTFNIT